jgi:hypothetical protein
MSRKQCPAALRIAGLTANARRKAEHERKMAIEEAIAESDRHLHHARYIVVRAKKMAFRVTHEPVVCPTTFEHEVLRRVLDVSQRVATDTQAGACEPGDGQHLPEQEGRSG